MLLSLTDLFGIIAIPLKVLLYYGQGIFLFHALSDGNSHNEDYANRVGQMSEAGRGKLL